MIVTNIMAMVLVTISTLTYSPKQYKITECYPTYPEQYVDKWIDVPVLNLYDLNTNIIKYDIEIMHKDSHETRDNPDVKIVEIHRIKYLKFMESWKEYKIKFSDEIISSERVNRIVTEQWVHEPSTNKPVTPLEIYGDKVWHDYKTWQSNKDSHFIKVSTNKTIYRWSK